MDEPKARSGDLSTEARLNAQLTEYQQCMESYRHTYQTIWQVGSFFAAISAGLFALSGGHEGVSWALVLSPVPILMWYLGIFLPMDGYGEARKNRLVAIEEKLDLEWNVEFSHYRNLATQLEWRPRPWKVKTAVTIFFCILTAVWIALIVLFVQDRASANDSIGVTSPAGLTVSGAWLGIPLRTTLSTPVNAFRFYSKNEDGSRRTGSWVTPVLPSLQKDTVRAALALPVENDMACMTLVSIPRGTPVEIGWVAPRNGQPGGGYQIYIESKPNPDWYAMGAAAPWESHGSAAGACASRL